MAWINIGGFDADSREWQLSQPFEGNLIRIENQISSPTLNLYNHRGLIAINYGFQDFVEIKVFYSTPKFQVFLFSDIDINISKYLAVKNISSRKNNNQWTINAYVWDVIINPYVPNIVIDSEPVDLSSQALIDIENLINNSVNNIAQQTIDINQQTTQILSLMTGGV